MGVLWCPIALDQLGAHCYGRADDNRRRTLAISVYCAVVPPSMTNSVPVTKDDSSDARYSIP